MFTRYSDIEIPENYSGNRFGRSKIEDTATKTHKMQHQGAASSLTLSPSFDKKMSAYDEVKSDTPPKIQEKSTGSEYIESTDYDLSGSISENTVDKYVNTQTDGDDELSGATGASENAFESINENVSDNTEDPESQYTENSDNGSPDFTLKESKKHKANESFASSVISRIAEMLEKSNPEDLLLVMLIILLASDTENKNDDIALTLALLLLSDKNKKSDLSGECI